MKTHTITFVARNDCRLTKDDVPALESGHVSIQTQKSLISIGTELTILAGNPQQGAVWGRIADYPFQPGYINVGVVTDVGDGIDREKWVGKRVLSTLYHTGDGVRKVLDTSPIVIPEKLGSEAALLSILGRIGMNGIRRGQLAWGETVVVFGAGLIGLLTAHICAIAGASRVFVVDVSDFRLSKLPENDIIVPINAKKQDVVKCICEWTHGRMADIAFELTGEADLIPQQIAVLRKQGRLVITSSPKGPTQSFDFHDLCNYPSISIIGAHNGSHPPVETPDNPWSMRRHTELFFDYVLSGRLNIDELITHQISYTEAPDFYHALLKDRSSTLGVVINWQ